MYLQYRVLSTMSTLVTSTGEVLQLIKRYLQELEVNDYTLEIKPALCKGDNYAGYVIKVQVRNKCNDVLYNWVVKNAPNNGLVRLSIPVEEMYKREILIYTEMFPLFKKFQEDYNVKAPFRSFPQYFTSSDIPPSEYVIMEDMNVTGFRLHSRHVSLDADHVRLVMKKYGQLHALSFALRDKNPVLFNELSKKLNDVTILKEHHPLIIESQLNKCKNALASLNHATDKIVHEKFENCLLDIQIQIKQLLKSESCGNHGVFNHGDCWNNNILFKYLSEDPSKPVDVCFVDWQLSRYGSPVLDISYFLFTCTNKETREQFYESFINDYYESVKSFLQNFGCESEKLFPYQVLKDHLKKFSLFGLYAATQILGAVLKDSKNIPEELLNLNSVEDALQKYAILNKPGKEYQVAIRDVLIDFNDYGYLFNS